MNAMNSPANVTMNIQVSGKHVAVGAALRSRIVADLTATVGKVFERGASGEVVVGREGPSFCVDVVLVLASGQQLVTRGLGGDAHSAFDATLAKTESRLRRYKRRLKNHHPHHGSKESAPYAVLRAPADEEDDEDWGADGSAGDGAPQAAIIAETETQVKTLTVSMAVMELDLGEAPLILFRNAGHGGLSVVYRRPDGNIGWIDPERSRGAARPSKADGSTAGVAAAG